MKRLILLIYLWVCLFKLSQCAKVLISFTMPSGSHHRLGDSLARGLLQHGFEVTMITPFETKNPPKNYSEVLITGMKEKFQEMLKENKGTSTMYDWESMPAFIQLLFLNEMGELNTDYVLSHPNIQKLLHSDLKFDAIIIEQFCNDGLKILAHHFNAPLIVLSSVGSNVWISTFNGVPEPPSYVPDLFLSYSTKMTFLQRAYNSFMKIFQTLNLHLAMYKTQKKLVQKHFPNYPDLDTVLYNTSLVLVNSHESINNAIPSVPNMVNIGGYHVSPPKPLPKDLKQFMDNAKEGIIYFSLGSNLIPSEMPSKTQATILKVLGSRKEKVLWKWDQEILDNKPPNVMTSKWFPQQDILAHPNLKLFMTHCGLLSITEAIYHGVPILGIPVFGDQKLNAGRAVTFGFGKSIIFSKITEDSLMEAINELLDNPKYKENAQYRSNVFHDRPQKPMDLAAYWVNYVIRHRGAPHLRVAGIDLPWYQYLMLDVVAALFGVVLVILYLVIRAFKFCFQKGNKSKQKLKKS